MKQENGKKSLRWLPLVIGLVVLLAAVGVILAAVLGGSEPQTQEPVQVDTTLYWNVDRDTYIENSETGLSTREPGEDGQYHLRMVSEGQLLDLVTPDKKLVNIIDTMSVCILQLDGTSIINVTDPIDLGYTMNKGVYIQKVDETTILANSSIAMNGMSTRVKISEQLQILDCREKESTLGQSMQAADLLVMDYVTVCFNAEGDATHVFLAGRTPRSSLYWRAEQFYSSSTKETTRVPDENGVYHIDFFCDGERVTLACKDKAVVTAIDKTGRLACYTCLVFDEEGYITDTKAASLGLKALTGCDGYTVTAVDGDTFTAAKMSGKNAGTEFSGALSADCKIYDVSKTALAEDRQGKAVETLQEGDRITVWTDTENNPILIYITIRLTDNPVYMSTARKYKTVDGKVQTSREPDAQGWYTVEMVKVGENTPRTFKTKDINVVNTIDAPTNRVAALALDGNVILRAYESECIYGYTPLGPRYVTAFVSNVYSAMTYKTPDSVVNGVVGADCKVYDFSGTGKLGAETTLREGDLIFIHRNAAEEAQAIFVTKRAMGEDHLYWNLGRQYDSAKKVTTREKDAEGWYVFNVAHKGKQTTVKTKNAEIATAMDAMTPGAMGLVVKNGVVQYAFDPIQTAGAVRVAFYSTVTAIDKDGTVHAVTTTGIESSFKPAADCKYYNTSAAYYDHKGEYTDGIRVNDLITGYLDMYGEAKFVYIYGRDVEEMYYNTQRMYDSKTKETTREPDADGWYVFQLVVDGKVKEMKTKDKTVATAVDKQTGPFGLLTKGNVIHSVVGADRVKNVDKVVCTNWNVIKVNGTKVTLQYQIPGSKDYTGKTMDVQLHKWHRAFDVSPTADVFGGQVKLQVGDRVQMYAAEDGKILYTYIASHNTREAGETGYCEHCKTEVHWEPWTGAAITNGGHYYVNANIESNAVVAIGTSSKDFEVVLDLNGKTVKTVGSRAFSIGLKEQMVVVDSVGKGIIAATGATEPKKDSDYAGGVINLYSGGKFTLYTGTLKHLGENSKLTQGGTVYLSKDSQFTMYGGTVIGGTVTGTKGIGGNIYSKGGKIELLGGTVTGGSSEHVAGNVYTLGAMTLKNVTVSGGKAANLGGNIYTEGALAMDNVTVTGGEAKNGGNIYSKGNLTAVNTAVTGGTASAAGADLLHNAADTTVSLSDSQFNNITVSNAATKLLVEGKVTVYRADLSSGVKITVGELDKASQIFVKAAGVFTEPNDKMGDYQACFGKAKDVAENDQVTLNGNVLQITHVRSNAPKCPHCNEAVEWQIWSGGAVAAGHYYLTDDITTQTTATVKTMDGVYLDLNGKTYDATTVRAFSVNGGYLAVMDTVGTGVVKGNNQLSAGKGSIANVIGGKFELYGGTLAPYAAVKGGTAFYISTSADGKTRSQFTVTGGTIDCSGLTGVSGADAALNIKGADFTMTGGAIKAETAMYVGANVVSAISGGEILGQVQVTAQTEMTLSGAPVLTDLTLAEGAKITLGELTDGASVAVDAVGAFSEANDNAQNYVNKNYIKALDPAASVVVNGGVMSISTEICIHCGKTAGECGWTELTVKKGALTSGHYFLGENGLTLEGSLTVAAGEDVIIDLRGKTLECQNSRCFDVKGNVSVIDTGVNGVMTGKRTGSTLNKGNIAIVNGGIFTMYGGTAIPATAMPYGSAFYITGGAKLTLKGGTIDCSALPAVEDTVGAIYVNTNSVFEMTGGTIKGAKAKSGGAVFVNAGSVLMTDGIITGGQVSNYGGAIFAMGASNVQLLGGTVSGNTAAVSGNDVVVGAGGTVTLAGKLTIGEISGDTLLTLGELKEGTTIGIRGEGIVSNPNANTKAYVDAGYFFASQADKVLAVENDAIKIETEAACPHCGKTEAACNWQALTATSGTLAAGHYYLSGPVTLTGEITVGGDVALDLRGQTLSYTGRCFKVSSGDLSILDTAEGGTIQGAGTSWGGAIYVAAKKKLNLYGGTVTAGSNTTQGGVIHVAGTMTMQGGTVTGTGTSTTTLGGALYVSGTFKMQGGTVNGASAKNGAAIYAKNATVTLEDGIINGGTAVTGGGVAYLHQCTTAISGGTYGGGTAKSGGNFFVEAGSFNVYGGTFNGGTVTNTAANVYILRYSEQSIPCNATITGGVFTCGTNGGVVTNKSGVEVGSSCTLAISGAPQIDALYLNTGVKMNVGAMSEGAKVKLAAKDTEVSAANTNMQSYVDSKFFEALEAAKKLTVTDGVLSLENAE